jgi:hypothetical protein
MCVGYGQRGCDPRRGVSWWRMLLEACGVRVVRVDLSGHDLWCRTGSGRLVSVQVKTCGVPRLDRDRPVLRYEFYDRGGSMRPDVFAFVALDVGMVLFLAGMGKRKNIRAW